MAQNVDETARKAANLRLLQRTLDRSILNIQGSATHVVLYHFHQSSQSWEKSNVEGSLFLAVRPSGYLLVILNRNSPDSYPIELSRDFQLQQNDPYLIFKNYEEGEQTATIRGIWFPNATERTQMNDLLTDVLQLLKTTPQEPPPPLLPVQPATKAMTPVDAASATAALLASLNLDPASNIVSNPRTSSSLSSPPTTGQSANAEPVLQAPVTPSGRSTSTQSLRQMSPSQHSNQPTLDKKSLQLALLSLIQDERFLDLLHAQYLKVHHARTSRSSGGTADPSNN
jgi:mRNA-decapping enzyme 1B